MTPRIQRSALWLRRIGDEPEAPADRGSARAYALRDVLAGRVAQEAEIAWSGTTMARFEGEQLSLRRCAR